MRAQTNRYFRNKKKKILVAMSGGVDSSVAAQLLVNQGHEVAGVFLRFWKDPQAAPHEENKCCKGTASMLWSQE